MADHDDLKDPKPHQGPDKKLTDKIIELALGTGGGAVTLLSGLLAAVLILYSGYVLYDTFATERAASSNAWDLLQFKPEILDDYDTPLSGSSLAEINPDYRAWLTVHDTTIDYPVVQGTNDLYYASHDIYQRNSLTGAIYLAAGNSPDFSDNYNLIYGHHMDNGAMFGSLDKMTGKETGVIVTGTKIYDVQFFAVVKTDAYENRIYNVGNRMNDALDFLASGGEGGVGVGTEVVYLNQAIAAEATKVIALSTCADAETSGRLVVFGTMTEHVVMTDVTVKKIWDDGDDQDGRRPESLTVTLSNGDKTVLSAENNWTATLSVPRFHNNAEISYRWTEEDVPGYTMTDYVYDADTRTTTLTNSHTPEVKHLTVRKVWEDEDNRDGLRPEAITAVLSNGASVTLNAENQWTASIDDLPVYASGETIDYQWTEEISAAGYTLSTETEDDITTLTNTHVPERTERSVEKVWDDKEDQDGLRPDAIRVTLHATGHSEDMGTLTLSAANGWKGTIGNLYAKEKGEAIGYFWTEEEVEGYTLSSSTEGTVTTLKNTHTPEVKSLMVTKIWDDNENQDGKRPRNLRVTLSNGQSVTLNEGNGWTATIQDLPVYAAGKEIAYSWTEDEIQDYTLTSTVPNGDVTLMTNRHETETTVATVTKSWDDDNNRDGIRPASITATLSNGQSVTLSEENRWTATIEGLPRYKNGTEISYTWTEEAAPGYTSATATDGTTTVFTNTHAPETIELSVLKVWDDANNQDGIRPTEITVTLNANGEAVESVRLNEGNRWAATATQMPLNENGKAIVYSWTEQATEGYSLTTETNGTTTTLTNTHEPATTSLTVRKVWDDAENQDGLRPAAVNATLSDGTRVTLNEANGWSATVEDLPVYRGGEAIDYSWSEDSVAGYTLTDSSTSGTVTTLTNTHRPETTSAQIQKIWDDDEDRDRIRPSVLHVNLTANGETIRSASLNSVNAWSAIFENLPAFENGERIQYAWTEEDISGYELSTETEGELTVMTNTHIRESIELTVVKVWDDDDNRDGARPEELNVTLSGDDGSSWTRTLTAEGGWTASIAVPRNQKGVPIAYTWTEENVANYQRSQTTEGNVTTFVNTHTPAVTVRSVTKVWDDGENQDGVRPETLEVTLLANNEPAETITLSAENEWTYTAENLPVYEKGEAIRYGWREERTAAYPTMTERTNGNLTTFTNTHVPETTTLTVRKVWNDTNNQDGLRPERLAVALTANGAQVASAELSEANGWTASVAELPVYANGTAIAYRWEEAVPAGYEASSAVSGNTTILTNTHEIGLTVATVAKIWDDDNDRDGIRPAQLTVTLSNGDSVVLNESNGWSGTVENLPRYRNGEEIEYTWTEENVEGYELISAVREGSVTTLTNRHKIARTDRTIVKVWEDNNNRDGIRPAAIRVTLKANGEDAGSAVLDESNGWTATVAQLPMNENGQAILYSWTEEAAKGYTLTTETNGTTTILTNRHEPEATSRTVRKVWDDAENQDGLRPASLAVALTANGAQEASVQLSEANDWTASVAGLPVYADGKAIEYRWEETVPEGYTSSSFEAENTTILTNTHETERTVATVIKVWDDDNDRDGIRPAQLTVTLNNGDSIVLNEANGWSGTVENLPRYRNGEEIEYTWAEENVEGYELVSTVREGSVTTLTNHHEIAMVDRTIVKIWDDDNNRDGLRPEDIRVTLKANGEPVYSVGLNEGNGWTATAPRMAMNENGQAIVYSWTEEAAEGYTLTTETSGTTTTLTNRHEPETASLTVRKVWDDSNNQDGQRPASVTVALTANGAQVASVELREANDWTASVAELPVYANGTAIEYRWEEAVPEGYTASSVVNGNTTILTNTHEIGLTVASVIKIWDDDNDRDGIRPAQLTVTLNNGDSVVLNEANGWSGTVENLPRYRNGEEIVYTWTEENVEGYELVSTVREGSVTTLTNHHDIALADRTIVKRWDDNDDQDGMRPERLFVTVNYNQTVELNEENNWTATVEDQPVYIDHGHIIIYAWREPTIPGYVLTGNDTEGTVTYLTNRHEAETTALTVVKVWNDEENRDGLRPESLQVTLKANGTPVRTETLSAAGNWTATIENLPVYSDGERITYTWDEATVEGYTLSTEAEGNTTTLTNTREAETTEVGVTKVWDDNNNQDGVRPAALTVTLSANGTPVRTVTLNAAGNWRAVIGGLPRYAEGTAIRYTWRETAVPGYTLSNTSTAVNGAGVNMTTLTNTHTPETTEVTVRMVWVDEDDSARPASVRVVLTGNGEAIPVTLSAANNWTATVDGVAKYAEGQEIAYRWNEPAVTGYEQTGRETNGNTTTITLTRVKTEETETQTEHWLTVHYRYMDGSEAAPTIRETHVTGESYELNSPAIDGFRGSTQRVNGVMPDRDVVYTVIYVPGGEGYIIIEDIETPLGLGQVFINAGECLE